MELQHQREYEYSKQALADGIAHMQMQRKAFADDEIAPEDIDAMMVYQELFYEGVKLDIAAYEAWVHGGSGCGLKLEAP